MGEGELKKVIVIARVSRTAIPVRQPVGLVMSEPPNFSFPKSQVSPSSTRISQPSRMLATITPQRNFQAIACARRHRYLARPPQTPPKWAKIRLTSPCALTTIARLHTRKKDGGNMSEGYGADPESIDGSSNLLVEMAGLLQEGRLDKDIGTLARVPHSHREVANAVDHFARFATDQHQDLVLLLTAMSTALKATGNNYTQVDEETRTDFQSLLDSSKYVAPKGGTA